MTDRLDIGEVTRRTGLPPSTLHYWERHGLVTPAGRHGLRRQYESDVIRRISVIVACQQAGFSVEEIRDVLDPAAFADGKQLLQSKHDELVERREALDRAITGLRHALDCDEPSPLLCDGFWSSISTVLPVNASTRSAESIARSAP